MTPRAANPRIRFQLLILGLLACTAAHPAPSWATIAASLQQCRDGSWSAPQDCQWCACNASASTAHWIEGESVPFRLLLSGVTAGSHEVILEWDFKTNDQYEIDYLTSYDRTETGADPCSGVTGCVGPPNLFAIPVDPRVTQGGYYGGVTQAPGSFACFGGTIQTVSAYTYADPFNSTQRIAIDFTATTATPVIAWSTHLATEQDWGWGTTAAKTASSSLYSMSLLGVDGSNGVQIRALAGFAVSLAAIHSTQVGAPTVPPGGSVSDVATMRPLYGSPTGTVHFFVCGPAPSPLGCPVGQGIAVGDTIRISSGTVASPAFTPDPGPAGDGYYCFRAEYSGDSTYFPMTHTNDSTECFRRTSAAAAVSGADRSDGFFLDTPAPNPSGGGAALLVDFGMPRAGLVRMALYDLAGRRLATLLEREMSAGEHAVQVPGVPLSRPSGIYLIRLDTPSGRRVREFVVAR
jgi:hypothetical protein